MKDETTPLVPDLLDVEWGKGWKAEQLPDIGIALFAQVQRRRLLIETQLREYYASLGSTMPDPIIQSLEQDLRAIVERQHTRRHEQSTTPHTGEPHERAIAQTALIIALLPPEIWRDIGAPDEQASERVRAILHEQRDRLWLEWNAALQTGQSARERLIEAHLYLVVLIAREYLAHGLPLLDLIQEGNAGLIRAAEQFDYAAGPFAPFATQHIREAIGRAVFEGKRGK